MNDHYDFRGLSYRNYQNLCRDKGVEPLPIDEALARFDVLKRELGKPNGLLDWEALAFDTVQASK